ncbi:hypothetical protein COLO4_30730 [Corchorus olitorius]|uniref:Uncharacterized protein n=1 Tax=Corchorus olitorius TaxID=93759 RepID=A0A1R3H721_9ROSI|nr:hypothetical protein COLO4_30730 [Corchorus olitorius]
MGILTILMALLTKTVCHPLFPGIAAMILSAALWLIWVIEVPLALDWLGWGSWFRQIEGISLSLSFPIFFLASVALYCKDRFRPRDRRLGSAVGGFHIALHAGIFCITLLSFLFVNGLLCDGYKILIVGFIVINLETIKKYVRRLRFVFRQRVFRVENLLELNNGNQQQLIRVKDIHIRHTIFEMFLGGQWKKMTLSNCTLQRQ